MLFMPLRHCSPLACRYSTAKLRIGAALSGEYGLPVGRAKRPMMGVRPLAKTWALDRDAGSAIAFEVARYALAFGVIAAVAGEYAVVVFEGVDDSCGRQALWVKGATDVGKGGGSNADDDANACQAQNDGAFA